MSDLLVINCNVETPALVDAWRSFPIDNVKQLPGAPHEIPLQLPLLIDHDFGFRVQEARTLTFIHVIQVEFPNRQVVRARSGVPVNLTEPEEAIGDKANLPSGRGWSHLNVPDVIANGPGNGDMADRFHLGQSVAQPLIFAVLKRVDQNLFVWGRWELIGGQGCREL